jgi:hypothetical protein
VLYFCCAGYPSAMTMLAVALLTIVAVSYHHRRVTPILPPAIGRTTSTRLRSPAEKAPNPPRQNTGSVQIPIAPDALPSHIFRGFLLWRFAYAGPRCAPRHLHGAGTRKPSHERSFTKGQLFERRYRKNFLVAASAHPGFLPYSNINTLCFDELG